MITILKRPGKFVNNTTAVIYEFTTDANIGNFDDYVCDVFIKSDYSTKTAIFRNVLPNRLTKIFSVNIADFLLSLQKNKFDFDFLGTKNLAIEKFTIQLNIRDGSQPAAELFSFDDYIFDNFVFTHSLSVVDTNNLEKIYSILGSRNFDENLPLHLENKNHFASPNTIEICEKFSSTISCFTNESVSNIISVAGITSANSNNKKGINTFVFSNLQLQSIKSLCKLTLTNCNDFIFAYPFDATGKEVVQFRFYNSKGGFSYFYAESKSESEARSKVEFFNNNYYNENELKSTKIQSNSDYKKTIDFSGSKIIQLKDLFSELLKSPKVEVLINQNYFSECEVTGTSADRYTHFDYKLTIKIDGNDNFKL